MLEPSVTVPLQTSPTYPAPPRVHWAVLLVVGMLAGILFNWFLPSPIASLADTLLWGAWMIYLCLWIRRLDPHAKSLLWAAVSIGVALASDAFDLLPNPSYALTWVGLGLVVSAAVLGIIVVFEIRAELQTHYNEREPIGLHLSGAMTFFFSYLYLQYHLYEIAQFKKRQAEGLIESAGRTLIP